MSKTLKDSKTEKEIKKAGKSRKDLRRPPQREKGGHKSIRELVEDSD